LRILVTGRQGQVAQSLMERAALHAGIEIVAAGRPELDLAAPVTVDAAIRAIRPDLVVSAAGYTAVDRAEDEPALARAINAEGAGAVAAAAARAGAPVIHLSTDYVFSGEAPAPYEEEDIPAPAGAYGQSKLEGERAVAAANPRHLILRTAWVYSPFGGNFIRTMLRLAAERDEVRVVSDQWGNPTSALDIADGILHAAGTVGGKADFSGYGVYHLAGTGGTNWSGFARYIMEASARQGGPHAHVREIATRDYPTRARRPANSRLSTEKFAVAFGWRAPDWRRSTEEVVRRLLSAKAG
jgi:dTDP-4-dehydrorhamnose reductase